MAMQIIKVRTNGKVVGYDTVNEFAAKMRVEPVTVYGWIYLGILPHIKVGSNAFIRKGTKKPTKDGDYKYKQWR